MVDASNVSRKLNRRPYYQPYIAGRWDDPALGGQWVTGGWGNKKPPYVDPDCSQVPATLIIYPMTSAPPRLQSGSHLETAHLGIWAVRGQCHTQGECHMKARAAIGAEFQRSAAPQVPQPPSAASDCGFSGAARNRYPGVPATAAQVRAYPPRPQQPPNSAAHFPNLRGRLRHPTPQCYKAQPAKVTLWRNCDPVVQ